MFSSIHSYVLHKWRYRHLFWSILFLFLVGSFVQLNQVGVIITQISFALTILLMLRTLNIGTQLMWFLRFLVAIALVGGIVGEVTYDAYKTDSLLILSNIIFAVFLGISVIIISNQINNIQKVDTDTISGAICVYLLLGFFWYLLFRALVLIEPNSFLDLVDDEQIEFTLLYFSFTTLTTLGYGDISPSGTIAMSLSNLEAIVGQLYIAIAIARLVGLYSMQQDS